MNYMKMFIVFLVFVFACTPILSAEEGIIVPGITYEKQDNLHLIFYDLNVSTTYVKPAIAGNNINNSLENVLEIASHKNAVVGINASYFGHTFNSSPVGEIKGILVIDGELISTISTVNPWLNAGIGITKDRRVVANRPVRYEITIFTNKGEKYRNILVNPLEWEGYDYIMIYSPKVGTRVPLVGSPYMTIHPLTNGGLMVGKRNMFKVLNIEEEPPVISGNTYVLTGIGKGSEYLKKNIKEGEKIIVNIEFNEPFKDIWQMIGGRLRMVSDGRNRLKLDHPKDNFEERMSAGRIGDKTLVLCCGTTTCYKMAEFLVKLGVTDAILLDGGGSANMVVLGENVYGGSRKVADALLIYTDEYNYGKDN